MVSMMWPSTAGFFCDKLESCSSLGAGKPYHLSKFLKRWKEKNFACSRRMCKDESKDVLGMGYLIAKELRKESERRIVRKISMRGRVVVYGVSETHFWPGK